MADIIDLNIFPTIETIDITVTTTVDNVVVTLNPAVDNIDFNITPNLITINVNTVSGGGDLSGYVPFDGDPVNKFASLNKISSNDVIIGNDNLDNETFIDVNYDSRFIKSIVTEPLDPSFSQILQTNNSYNIFNQQYTSGLFSILFGNGQTKLGGDDNYFSTDESIGIKGFTYNDINFAQINIPSGVIGYDTNTQSAYLGDNFNDATGGVIKVLGTSSEINLNAAIITANGSSILPIVKTGSFSAKNEEEYIIVNGTCTVIDPTGYLGRGYKVYVRDGSAIIGGVTYGEGSLIYRYYYASVWTSKNYNIALSDILTTTITDGDTTHAPDGNAVFDALALKENSANKQNSLTTDGTGVKFPTVDAVNTAISNVNINAVDKITVKLSVAINKGQAVYISSANGTNIIVSKASNTSEATSSKTLGLLDESGIANDIVNVVTSGLIDRLDTSSATVGDPVWLGVSGNLIFGLVNKPTAPAHLVYIGVVSRVSATVGEIIVKVQNGFELNEIHDVSISSVADNNILAYDSATSLWKNKTASNIGIAPLASPTFTGTVVLPSTTSIGTVSSTEIGYLDNVTSAIQTQLNAKQDDLFDFYTKKGVVYINDFECFDSNSNDGRLRANVTGGNFNLGTIANLATNRVGIARLNTGTTISGLARIISINSSLSTYNGFFFGGGEIIIETDIQIGNLSTITDRYEVYFGIYNSTGTNGLYIQYQESTSPNWIARNFKGGVTTSTTTSTAVATSWQKLKIVVNANATQIDFYVNGSIVATHTTNIPSGITEGGNINLTIIKTTGITNRFVDSDYIAYKQTFTTQR